MNYNPQPGSLPSNVIGFFRLNRDEHLTLDDITSKFGGTYANIHTCLRQACDVGLLERDRNDDGEYIYKAGKQLPQPMEGVNIDHAHEVRVQTVRVKLSMPQRGKASRKHINIDKLKVDSDVPYTAFPDKNRGKWEPLFHKLKKEGDSVALPLDFSAALAAAARKARRDKLGTFRVAKVNEEECRVWRLA